MGKPRAPHVVPRVGRQLRVLLLKKGGGRQIGPPRVLRLFLTLWPQASPYARPRAAAEGEGAGASSFTCSILYIRGAGHCSPFRTKQPSGGGRGHGPARPPQRHPGGMPPVGTPPRFEPLLLLTLHYYTLLYRQTITHQDAPTHQHTHAHTQEHTHACQGLFQGRLSLLHLLKTLP